MSLLLLSLCYFLGKESNKKSQITPSILSEFSDNTFWYPFILLVRQTHCKIHHNDNSPTKGYIPGPLYLELEFLNPYNVSIIGENIMKRNLTNKLGHSLSRMDLHRHKTSHHLLKNPSCKNSSSGKTKKCFKAGNNRREKLFSSQNYITLYWHFGPQRLRTFPGAIVVHVAFLWQPPLFR